MLIVSDVFNGEYKMCPRCKGHKYIIGQKTTHDGNYSSLPNYIKISKGLCFLCEGKGQAFFTTDNRVVKSVVSKNGNDCVLEFDAETGVKIRIVPSNEYLDKNKLEVNKNKNMYSLSEEDLFPTMYEMIWSDWSRVADVIFEEYPNAKAISINRFDEERHGVCINFLFYYDEKGNFIKPNFIKPPYDSYDDIINASYNGIVLLNKHYVGVSGTYIEKENSLNIGFKTKDAFKYYELENINISKNKYDKSIKVSYGEEDTIFKLDVIKSISIKALNDMYKILEEL